MDFEDEESLAAAITKDKQELEGRQLTIARSAPKGGRGGGGRGGNVGRGRGLDTLSLFRIQSTTPYL